MEFVREALTSLLETLVFILSSYPLNVIIILLTVIWIIYNTLRMINGLNSKVDSYRK